MTAVLAALRLALALAVAAWALSGCSTAGYYWQSVSGHLQMMNAARPVAELLADPQTASALKPRLELSQRIRSFAVTQLQLPDNASYHRYADLHRSAVVWNVVAAPELSLELKTWCFPVTGCVGYRGYFSEADAQREAAQLKTQGLEVSVYGVPAYSTLGWMNWAGGDPLLNTFVNYPEGELARLIFHELAHQVVYASGDTEFNESFATAVERLGSRRWLATEAGEVARGDYAALDQRRQDFRALALATRRELAAIYPSNTPEAQSLRLYTAAELIAERNARLNAKAAAMQRFRGQYAALKATWAASSGAGAFTGYDAWVARANNASLGAQAAYDDLVPGFEALFERSGHDWQRFYDAVRHLASLPKAQRHAALSPTP